MKQESRALALMAMLLLAGASEAAEECRGWKTAWSGCKADGDCLVISNPCGWPTAAANARFAEEAARCNIHEGAALSCAAWEEMAGGKRQARCRRGRCVNVAGLEDRGEPLTARVSPSCAPWGGLALQILLEKIGVTAELYDQDIEAFESGKTVIIKSAPGKMGSRATLKDKTSVVGWKPVGLELRSDPGSKKGRVVFNGSERPLTLLRDRGPRSMCR